MLVIWSLFVPCILYLRLSKFQLSAAPGCRPLDRTGKKLRVRAQAESGDGINWSRPSLGLFKLHWANDNNIVWTGSGGHESSSFRDLNPDGWPEGETVRARFGPRTSF